MILARTPSNFGSIQRALTFKQQEIKLVTTEISSIFQYLQLELCNSKYKYLMMHQTQG